MGPTTDLYQRPALPVCVCCHSSPVGCRTAALFRKSECPWKAGTGLLNREQEHRQPESALGPTLELSPATLLGAHMREPQLKEMLSKHQGY